MQHKTPEYKKINPNMKVPALTEKLGDGSMFKLFESNAMLIYLSESKGIADHWYPKDH